MIFNSVIQNLSDRRLALCALAGLQRAHMSQQLASLANTTHHIDQRISTASSLVRNPILLTAASVALAWVGPRGFWAWTRKGVEAWLLWKSIAPALSTRRQQHFSQS